MCLLIFFSGCREQDAQVLSVDSTTYFRLAEIHPPDHPTTQADQEFARLVEEKTQGRIVIKVYDNQKLGTEKEVIEQVQFGGIDFARLSTSTIAEIAPQLNVLQLPYIYRDSDHMWMVLNSHIGDYLLASIKEQKLIGFTWFDAGARNFYNNVREVKTMQDLQGLKLRVMESQLMVDMMSAIGASAVAMPYGEVYSSLQRGLIDGAENNYPSYDVSKHYEISKYYTIDEHLRIPELLIASEKIVERITKEDLALIMESAAEAQVYQKKLWARQEKESEEIIRAAGVIITPIEQREEFVEAMKPLYEVYAKDYLDLVEEIQTMK
jgi:tripartite ATP-independent transporter DctP family solute receptor